MIYLNRFNENSSKYWWSEEFINLSDIVNEIVDNDFKVRWSVGTTNKKDGFERNNYHVEVNDDINLLLDNPTFIGKINSNLEKTKNPHFLCSSINIYIPYTSEYKNNFRFEDLKFIMDNFTRIDNDWELLVEIDSTFKEEVIVLSLLKN